MTRAQGGWQTPPMPDDLLALADRLYTGAAPIEEHHPFRGAGELAEVQPGAAFVQAFANSAVFATPDGLVVVDTSGVFHAQLVHDSVRAWSPARLDTAVFTHGHIDHVFGVDLYEEEARTNGWEPPRVIAHELVAPRFERYRTTAGYNAVINRRQFGIPALQWPVDYRFPDVTYRETLSVEVGGEQFELRHDRGETDDGTWVWIPARRVLCTGDLFVWASPNCGNPQKVQRYAADWAVAMRQRALLDSASLLESLLEQTLAMMNEGARLDDIVHTVRAPQELLDRPYLRPIYDEPEFVVRGIWRFYGGWWDGNPAHLKPAPEGELAREIASLAGGAAALAQRASDLAAAGDLRLAGHLAELAALAAPGDAGVHRVRAEVFGARARAEASTMSKGVFGWAERDSQSRT
jgi:glyoxylase-like metal-dependent hydrolase (beta-lactamase superfamily II)